MRKILSLCSLLFAFSSLVAQKKVSVAAMAHFDFATRNLSTNDAGIGATLAANFFARKRLQLRTEVSVDHFIGSKLLLVDVYGNAYPSNPTVIYAMAGPEVFFTKSLSFAGLYGYAHYSLFDLNVNEDAIKLVLQERWGTQKKWMAGLSLTSILRKYNVRFFGVGLGYRLL